MHFDPINTLTGRHLAMAYATVALIQGGYFAMVLTKWWQSTRPPR